MTAAASDTGSAEDRYTVDELAAATGMTVRTTRYYAGLGLLPPPERRGRMAYYSGVHRARLELIRSLQDHGYTLAAIEKYLARLPLDATTEDLAIQRVMLTGWQRHPSVTVTRRELERRLGRPVDADVERLLVEIRAVRRDGERFELLESFELTRRILALDLPVSTLAEADRAITRHMDELADELSEVLRTVVVGPFRRTPHTEDDTARFEETMTRLRELTVEAIVLGFQRAANQVIDRALTRD